MEVKWPKTLGDRDRRKQYESYIKPVSAEEKITITQNAHSKTQKELSKAKRNFERAITHYFKAEYGAKEVIGKLDKTRIEICELQEEIKKLTMNALPYKDLDLERENEKMFKLPLKKISLQNIVYFIMIFLNLILYISAFVFSMTWLYVIGGFLSIGIFLSWFAPWSRNTEEILATSKKIGPKI